MASGNLLLYDYDGIEKFLGHAPHGHIEELFGHKLVLEYIDDIDHGGGVCIVCGAYQDWPYEGCKDKQQCSALSQQIYDQFQIADWCTWT